jgi:hypothetical protein
MEPCGILEAIWEAWMEFLTILFSSKSEISSSILKICLASEAITFNGPKISTQTNSILWEISLIITIMQEL